MIKLEFTIEQINTLINALNQPMQAGAITLASLIKTIAEQAAPQATKEEDGTIDGE
jgi:hypothetical protein